MILMAYIHGNPGGLRYPRGVPKEIWGERQQLKIARNIKLLEVFSDIAYGTGSRGRSVQGMAIYFGGCIISWQTSIQPFVTHSTAESELVAYCDSLNAGRSAEAMLSSMMGIQSGSNEIERVIYGDNVAAIGLAHGTSSSSWRTRHLKIRAGYLREALEGRAPGGIWRLMHLRGSELVADGLTKPLLGQAFAAFLTDLGMLRQRQDVEVQHDTGVSGAAIMALMTGSVLLSGMDEVGGEDEADSGITWICGAVLMALGAVYLGQTAFSSVRCCLRRLHGPSRQMEEGSRAISSEESDSGGETSVKIKRGKGSTSERSSLSLSFRTQSGWQRDDDSTSPVPSRTASDVNLFLAGSATKKRGAASSSADGGQAAAAGSCSRSTASGSAAAADSCSRPTTSGFAAAAAVSEDYKSPKEIANPWNQFQHDFKGKGFSKATLAKMYKYQKMKDQKKMP
jgi:hypothetical protein